MPPRPYKRASVSLPSGCSSGFPLRRITWQRQNRDFSDGLYRHELTSESPPERVEIIERLSHSLPPARDPMLAE